MGDFKIIETGDGGDIALKGNDIRMIDGFQNMPYLGMFGGNYEGSTEGDREDGEESVDWWGNRFLMENNEAIQLNSFLERSLDSVTINSSGRLELISVIKKDLEFLTEFVELEVDVVLVNVDRIRIELIIKEPETLTSNQFTYIWDSTNNELSELNNDVSTTGTGVGLNNLLNFEL